MAEQEAAIVVKDLYKSFRLPHEQSSGLKQSIVNFARRKKGYETQRVLNDISFEIKKGEFFGIVGRNGSGKSTLLKLLAGIYVPDRGLVQLSGSLTPFIELGVGFNPELTGRENVFLNGALLGFSRGQMESMYDDIVSFAELGRFMDQKLKNYSSGMQVRLAFSIAIRAKGDILLLDEVLAVGDTIFQKKCYDYFKQLKKEKKTVVLVSHDTGVLQEYCTNGVLIEGGKVVRSGDMRSIVGAYSKILRGVESSSEKSTEDSDRWGSGEVEVTKVVINSSSKTKTFSEDEEISMLVEFTAKQDTEEPVLGVTISDMAGKIVFQSNTLWLHKKVQSMAAGDVARLHLNIPNSFNTGTYTVSPAVSDSTGTQVLDWREGFATFKTDKQQKSHGIINQKHELSVKYDTKS